MQSTVSSPALNKPPTNMQEFGTLYQAMRKPIYRYVYHKIGNREDAEDLTSEIFLKAARGIDQQRSPQSVHSWLYLIARTTIADYWRVYGRGSTYSLDEMLETGWEGPMEEEPIVTNGAPYRVQYLLQALSKRDQEVLTYRFLLDLSIKSTALRMGLTATNVKVLQFRALKRAARIERVITEQ